MKDILETWSGSPAPVVLLYGAPRSGKTRAMGELAAKMHAQGGRVASARLVPDDRRRPYAAWVTALGSHAAVGTLAPLLLELGAAHSVARLLASLAQEKMPVAVLFDDAQFLDPWSVAMFEYVLEALARAPIRFVCAADPAEIAANEPAWRFLESLRQKGRLRAHTL
jgi:hypothetical protein